MVPNREAYKYTYGIIDIPDSNSANFSNFLDKHKKMEELGFVSINDTKRDKHEFGKSKNGMVEISLTPKGKDYLVGKVENLFGKFSAQFKSCEYKIIDIVEIQEIPDPNEAKVKVDFERYNETPFFEEKNEKANPKDHIKQSLLEKPLMVGSFVIKS